MGKYFIDDSELTRVTFEDGQWVDIKTELTQGDRDAILTGMAQATAKGKEANLELKLGSMLLLQKHIVAWSFTDDEGKPMPVTPENISRLKGKYRTVVLNKINELDEVSKRFVKN